MPQIVTVLQSGNLYVYGINSPVYYKDSNGEDILSATESFLYLSDFYPTFVTGISAIFASLGASFWTGIGVFIGAAAAGTLIYELVTAAEGYLDAAEQAKVWVRAQIAAGGINTNELHNHSVYVIIENSSSNVVYVGRTKDYSIRQYEHQKSKNARFPMEYYTMMPVATGMTLNEARSFEQSLITAYTLDALQNAINSIAECKWRNFLEEFNRIQMLLSGVLLDN